jgi:sirohydrochlorin ferrochelatase
MPGPTRTAIVLVAHGSKAAAANDAHLELARTVEPLVESTVIAAFLEIASPSVGDAIDDAIERGASVVLVHPHFLAPGNHTTVDIPRLVDEARTRHPTVSIEVTAHTGDDPAMATMLADVLRSAEARR